MTAANVNAAAIPLYPIGGSPNVGWILGVIDSADKASQNDTITVTNAKAIMMAKATTDADGVDDPVTISDNVLTLTGATATSASLLVVYKPK